MVTKIRKYLGRLRYSAWALEGPEIRTGHNLRMLYVGGSETNKNYIANMAFGKPLRETFYGRHWMLRPEDFSHGSPADLAVAEIDKTHRPKTEQPSFYVPCWVDGVIDVDEALRLAKTSESVKSDVRRVKKYGYTYEIRRDKEAIGAFYETMYLPYIKGTYGNEAAVHSLDTVVNKYDQCELLLVKHGETRIAGEVIVYPGRKQALPLCIGVLNGDRDYVRKGAVSALYYYRLYHLKSRGARTIDIGASRGFLNDGVLRYKKKWGLCLTGMRASGFLIHRIQRSPGARAFLLSHPFLNRDDGGLRSVCFVDDPSGLSERRQKKIVADFVIPGIAQLQVLQVNGTGQRADFRVASPVPVEVGALPGAGKDDLLGEALQRRGFPCQR